MERLDRTDVLHPHPLTSRLARVGRFDRYDIATGVLLAVGALVRALAAFPVHKLSGDADSLLTGMCALHVLHGHFPAFLAVARQGAAECYLAAGAFAIFGYSRGSLFGEAFLMDVAGLVAAYFFARELIGRKLACLALLIFAVPSAAVLLITYMPVGHSTTFFLMAMSLFLTARIERVGPSVGNVALWGLFAGLGVWHTLLTLGVSLPAAVWLIASRADVRRLRHLATALGGAVVGAAPWIAYNVLHPLAYFKESVALGGRHDLHQTIVNAGYALTNDVVGLVVPRATTFIPVLAHLRPVVLAFFAATIGYAAFALGRAVWTRGRATDASTKAATLALLVVVGSVAILAPSGVGAPGGWTVRYMLGVWLVAVPLAALLVHRVWRSSRVVATVAVACVVVLPLTSYTWPGMPVREAREQALTADSQLIGRLRAERVDAAIGNYWSVYPINFLTKDQIRGVPCAATADWLDYEARVSGHARWALVEFTNATRSWIPVFVHRRGVKGRFDSSVPGYRLFLPSPNPPHAGSAAFIALVRSGCV